MSHIVSNVASGLANSWLGGSIDESQARGLGSVQDLIDSTQTSVFDALKELSGLRVASSIEIPQLIVVGDQSTGKSSLLEAIGRFHFPVASRVCTQFPTKLSLRRSHDEHTLVSIQPAASRTEPERERLEQFKEKLSRPEEFPAIVERVRAELGVSASPLHGTSGSREPLKFVEDVLVVRSSGPGLTQLDLVDLPGLFSAATQHQDDTGKRAVDDMVKQYIRSRNSLILLVVSVATSFAGSAALAMIQDMAKTDPSLEERVIGVMTNPDRAVSIEDALDVLNGTLDSTNLRHPWLVVKNQDQRERGNESLSLRDKKEERFLLDNKEWQRVPSGQWGIQALRSTLRTALIRHTQAALPGVIAEIEAMMQSIVSRLAATSCRSTDHARRLYLYDIAQKFTDLTREACLGTYHDKECREMHKVSEECRGCTRFFPRLSDESPDVQQKNLRAYIRLLSRAFAFSMREYGKTKMVVDTAGAHDNTNEKGSGVDKQHEPTSSDNPVHGLLSPGIIASHYTFPAPDLIDRQGWESWLASRSPHFRSREPQGEVSEITYHLLFEYQSEKWRDIASKHLTAVWTAVETFVDLALDAACPFDAEVRSAISKHITSPALEDLKRKSQRTMNDLLSCHSRGHTGFYDGFVNIAPLQQRTRELSQGLDNHLSAATAATATSGSGSGLTSDEVFKAIMLMGTTGCVGWLGATGILASELSRGSVLRQLGSAFSAAYNNQKQKERGATNSTTKKGENSSLSSSFVIPPRSLDDIAAARAVEHVEMFYEMSMMSFVGYVNSLVVEGGILRELPEVILTQGRILRENDAVIEMIAGERPSDARKRERDEADLETLSKVLETLKACRHSAPLG